jgi:Kef-type K+ transport system membrane component KefB
MFEGICNDASIFAMMFRGVFPAHFFSRGRSMVGTTIGLFSDGCFWLLVPVAVLIIGYVLVDRIDRWVERRSLKTVVVLSVVLVFLIAAGVVWSALR